ncbi:MAG: HD-GYP domain-containing protein [Lachnospiraceae bacterium]|nr:HD-GYP domain-containing protein [Lachnospiraceae bacterium]
MKMKDVTFAAVLFSIVANFVLFPIMYFTSGGFHGGMPLWLLLSLVISWVVIRKRSILFVVYGLSIIFQSGCIIYSQAHPEVVVLFQTEQAVVWDIIQSMILVSLIFGMIIKFHERAYETKKNELDKANAALAKANERITLQSMYTLAKTIDAKDKYTNGHSMRVAGYSRMIAERMGYSEADLEDIYNMAMLHDIGKIGVPDAIINKPTKLTDEEFYIIRKHPVTGYEILSEMPEFKEISAGARWHHERYDGTGYPDGLAGEDIPLFARIITVADAYDAMTSNRSYRLYMSQDTVIAELKKGKGKQFDPDITDVMLEIIKEDSDYEFREGQFTHQDAV